ncbi:MAG: WD40/YVTN/BNR-like repeat-containing protein [Bryobacteraceae bacterium]
MFFRTGESPSLGAIKERIGFMYLQLLQISAALAALCGGAVAQSAPKQRPASVPYTWKNVQIVGGGFVDGIVFHPTAKVLRYARTDIGGAYRWNDIAHRWEALLDWVPCENLNWMGVESIAVDASDPNRVYLACGTYTNPTTPDGAILRSSDRGRTFQHTNVPFKFGGNEAGRGHGERLAVDPNDGAVLYLGTRHDGLWKSADRAVTWSKVDSLPDLSEGAPAAGIQQGQGSGIVFVVFDPRGGVRGKPSSTIYAGVSLMGRDNLFRSKDAGKTWQPVPGAPTQYRPARAALASDGALYVAYLSGPNPYRPTDGGIWKLDTASGAWTDITPDRPDAAHDRAFGYVGVSVDAHRPRTLIASTYYRPGGEEVFRSVDGGTTWKGAFASGGTYDFSLAPYVAKTRIHWLFDVEIDPANSDHAIFTTGYGGYETFNLTAMDSGKPTKWSVMSRGIEETVALDLYSPPEGAHLLTAIGDYGGFVHADLDKPAPEGSYNSPRFGNTTGLAGAANSPEMIVRVGRAAGNRGGGNIGYSMDGGRTWQPTPSVPPNASMGSIAVSSDGATWVWTPEGSAVYCTNDFGGRWTQSEGIPANTRVLADPVNPRKFYGLALFDGKLFVSMDGAATFTAQPLPLPDGLPTRGGDRGDGRGGQDRIYAMPGREGDLWLAAFNGLYHSTDGGLTFARLGHVERIHAFGFGKAAPGDTGSTLYLIGVVDGVRGIFRSTNAARSWVRINDDRHQWGLLLQITGDPKQFGRVYVGTHGRGIIYGDPAAH